MASIIPGLSLISLADEEWPGTIRDDGPESDCTLLKTIHCIEMTLIATMGSFQYYNILCTYFHFELQYFDCFQQVLLLIL